MIKTSIYETKVLDEWTSPNDTRIRMEEKKGGGEEDFSPFRVLIVDRG